MMPGKLPLVGAIHNCKYTFEYDRMKGTKATIEAGTGQVVVLTSDNGLSWLIDGEPVTDPEITDIMRNISWYTGMLYGSLE